MLGKVHWVRKHPFLDGFGMRGLTFGIYPNGTMEIMENLAKLLSPEHKQPAFLCKRCNCTPASGWSKKRCPGAVRYLLYYKAIHAT